MKIAIVTGASSGIGYQFCRELDRQGGVDQIWAIARRGERLEQLKGECTTLVRPMVADLSAGVGVELIGEALDREKPTIKWLINNAGFGKHGDFADIALGFQLEMISVNISAVVHLSHRALPYLAKGSKIINVSSVAAFGPLGGFGVYAATKSFVNSFSLALGAELAARRISVTAVCPGPVDTEFSAVARLGSTRQKTMYGTKVSPEIVVNQALRDAKRGRVFSLYGKNRWLALVMKVLPQAQVARWSLKAVYRKRPAPL